MNKKIYIGIVVLAIVVLIGIFALNNKTEKLVTSFEECVEAGGTVASTYPEQCWMTRGGERFIEQIKNIDNVDTEVIDNTDNTILPFKSGINGIVLIGPTCPGPTRIDSSDNCGDKPYQTVVQVVLVQGSERSVFTYAETDSEGRFSAALPPGNYSLQPRGGSVFPRCGVVDITVKPDMVLGVELLCDSGIR
jgi:hypothetical protein